MFISVSSVNQNEAKQKNKNKILLLAENSQVAGLTIPGADPQSFHILSISEKCTL